MIKLIPFQLFSFFGFLRRTGLIPEKSDIGLELFFLGRKNSRGTFVVPTAG
jgi:hypothetical protein